LSHSASPAGYFWDRVPQPIWPGWPWIAILLISVRIIGVSHLHLAMRFLFNETFSNSFSEVVVYHINVDIFYLTWKVIILLNFSIITIKVTLNIFKNNCLTMSFMFITTKCSVCNSFPLTPLLISLSPLQWK
jgi:hypothetical protein